MKLALAAALFLNLLIICSDCYCQFTNPRAWAEWEETDGIIIHQPNFYLQENPTPVELMVAEEWDSLYVDLLRGLSEEGVKVYYILDTNYEAEYCPGILDTMQVKYGIDVNDQKFHVVYGCKEDYPELNKWTRDHGPMNVYRNGADSLYFILFRDDYRGAGAVIRDYLGMPDTVFYDAISGSLASDGGNYIVDGYSAGIINDGPGAILPLIKDHFGLDTVYALTDYLPHADYYLKMLNEETLVISAQEPGNYTCGSEPFSYEEDSAILAGMVSFLQEQVVSQYGRPMKVYQVVNPPSVKDDSLQLLWYTEYASYTNSLIVNRSIFVPQFGIPASDSLAVSIYRQAMPGYRIVPVFSRRGAAAGGAVHCLTNSVASSEPVLIKHSWFYDTVAPAPSYEITANIMTRSGVKNAGVLWATSPAGPFLSVEMEQVSQDCYSGSIPRAEGVTDIYYYIAAESNSGRTGIKPMVAPDYTYHCVIRNAAPGWVSHPDKAPGSIKIYPNPATSIVTVDCSGLYPGNGIQLRLILYDLMGRKVMEKAVISQDGSFRLDVSALPPGQYFVVLVNDRGEFFSGKIVKAGE